MSNILTSNITQMGIVTITYDPANIATITADEDTVTVQGLKVGDYVALIRTAHVDGAGICDCRVSADNTLSVTWVNPTAGGVNQDPQTFLLFWARPDQTRASVTP